MDLATDFKTFLQEIRPTANQRSDLQTGHTTLRDRLNADENLKDCLVSDFLQGSYRRATAVRPKGDRRSDVDIIVVTKLSDDEYTPAKAMDLFKPFLNKHYKGKWRQQGRSFGIELSYVELDLVLTSAPSEAEVGILESDAIRSDDDLEAAQDWRLNGSWVALSARYGSDARALLAEAKSEPEWKSEPLRIPDRDANKWEPTHPIEQIKWTRDKNDRTSKHFVNVVKAIKWWRVENYDEPKHPKGFPLERLIGECCPDGIGSVAEGVVKTLEQIVSQYALAVQSGSKPVLPDYGVPSHDVFKRISVDDFKKFYEQVEDGADLARRAYDSQDRTESGKLWRELFGSKFPKPPEKRRWRLGRIGARLYPAYGARCAREWTLRVTSALVLPPPAIERGIRCLGSVTACVIEGQPTFHAGPNQWVVTFTIQRDVGVRFIGTTTRWCAVIDASYPFGDIAIYPASEGGITATFAHQSRNMRSQAPRTWRQGKLCLDSPFGGERLLTLVRDPFGDAEARLRWHIERAQLWLHHAANDQLLAPNDPFELPARPARTTVRKWERHRVVHDESASSFDAWRGREGAYGPVLLGAVPEIGTAIGAGRFAARNTEIIREWAGSKLETVDDVAGFWWLWPNPIVLEPWEAPATWGELRRIARAQGLDADEVLRWLLPELRGSKRSGFLLLGYPIALRVGAPVTEVHWDAYVLPKVPAASGKPPRGFRPNAIGWWHRERYETFADKLPLQCLPTENWSPERLQARGRLPRTLRDLRIALLGVGALGSSLADMLARAGANKLALVDGGLLEAGNVCRHTATLLDVGKAKVQAVAQRIRQASPMMRVTEIPQELAGSLDSIVERLDKYDVIIDCTSSDQALLLLGTAWWSIPRIFASFSMGFAGKRLFSFGLIGHRFPQDEFARSVQPWLEHDAKQWAEGDEILEGAGCWSPLFPARQDDVVLAAATCVKELETLVAKRPKSSRFRVFAQKLSDDGFEGFTPESAPPSVSALAS